jgi:NADPH:quinone reductase-like Zn-dependent oxidoreductase
MRQIWIPRTGPPEVLEVREAPDPLPARGQLRIRVEAVGVNFADIMGRLGVYPDLPKLPVVPGYEVAGRVDAVGEEIETDWIGRDVLALTRFGGYSDTVCVNEIQAFARPPGMSAEQGAAIPINYLTALLLVEFLGGLRSGESILIHSAGGGVGIAAIQLARRIGARIYGTASASKHEYLKSVGVEHTIDYTQEDFEKRVMELSHGRGVELVLDAVGGKSFKKSFRVLSPTGRLGMFGMSAGITGKKRSRLAFLRAGLAMPWFSFSPPALMNANKGVFGVNVGRFWDESARVAGWMETLLGYYTNRQIEPVLAAAFSFGEAADAHHYLQERRNLGKVVLSP